MLEKRGNSVDVTIPTGQERRATYFEVKSIKVDKEGNKTSSVKELDHTPRELSDYHNSQKNYREVRSNSANQF